MSFAMFHNVLSVDSMIALQEGNLRVKLPGGFFKVVHRSYMNSSACKVYDRNLSVEMVISLKPEGGSPVLNQVPANRSDQQQAASFANLSAN